MLSHKQIWAAIDTLASRYGHSPSGLARAAGLDPTTFNKSKRLGPKGRLRWPSTESVSKILQVTGASIEDFVAAIARVPARPAARTLPLISLKDAAKKRVFGDDFAPISKVWDHLTFPDLPDDTAFAVEVSNDAAAPVYRIGDVLIASPKAELRRGDRVILRAKDGCSVGQFVRQTGKRVNVKSLNPSLPDRQLERNEVQWMARIVWARQ